MENTISVSTDMVEVVVVAKELKEALNTVKYAMSNDTSKIVLCGINVIVDKNSVILEALDGFRLARKTLKFNHMLSFQNKFNFQLDSDQVKYLANKVPNRKTENVTLCIDLLHRRLYVYTKDDRFDFIISDGQFIPCDKLLLGVTKHLISLPGEVLKTLKGNKNNITEKNKRVELDVVNDNLKISYLTEEGLKDHNFTINNLNNTRFNVNVNANYFVDALSKVKDESYELGLNDNIYQGIQLSTPTQKHIIMPLKVQRRIK